MYLSSGKAKHSFLIQLRTKEGFLASRSSVREKIRLNSRQKTVLFVTAVSLTLLVYAPRGLSLLGRRETKKSNNAKSFRESLTGKPHFFYQKRFKTLSAYHRNTRLFGALHPRVHPPCKKYPAVLPFPHPLPFVNSRPYFRPRYSKGDSFQSSSGV